MRVAKGVRAAVESDLIDVCNLCDGAAGLSIISAASDASDAAGCCQPAGKCDTKLIHKQRHIHVEDIQDHMNTSKGCKLKESFLGLLMLLWRKLKFFSFFLLYLRKHFVYFDENFKIYSGIPRNT